MTKQEAKAIIKAEIERVNNLCVNVRNEDYSKQKTYPGNTTLKGMVEWVASGNEAHIEHWKPIDKLRIKKISPNNLTLAN